MIVNLTISIPLFYFGFLRERILSNANVAKNSQIQQLSMSGHHHQTWCWNINSRHIPDDGLLLTSSELSSLVPLGGLLWHALCHTRSHIEPNYFYQILTDWLYIMLLISEIIVKFTLVIDITPVECDDHQSIRPDSISVLPLMYKLGFPQFSSPQSHLWWLWSRVYSLQ